MPASVTEVQKAVVSAIGGGAANVWGVTLDDDKRSDGEIKHAIVEADADVVMAILETPDHPFRNDYLVQSGELIYSATGAPELPASIGDYGPVEIRVGFADTAYKVGEPASRTDIELWRRNPGNVLAENNHNVVNSVLGGYYHILPPKIYFTGYAAKIYIGQFTPNYATPACAAPVQYTQAIVAGTVARLYKEGVLTDGPFQAAERRFEMYIQLIRTREINLPPIEQLQRAA